MFINHSKMESLFQDAPGLVRRTDMPRALWGQWGALYEPAELVFPLGILVLWPKSAGLGPASLHMAPPSPASIPFPVVPSQGTCCQMCCFRLKLSAKAMRAGSCLFYSRLLARRLEHLAHSKFIQRMFKAPTSARQGWRPRSGSENSLSSRSILSSPFITVEETQSQVVK